MNDSKNTFHLSGTLRSGLLMGALVVAQSIFAQSKIVDKRDQATGWYVPVTGQVTVEGEKMEGVELQLYRDNQELGKVMATNKGKFSMELDIDAAYTILVKKPGYQTKMIYVNTALPKDLVQYPSYECKVDMKINGAHEQDPFYSDFPSAMVKYDPEMKGFYHSEHYLAHIQNKLNSYASMTK